MVLMKNILKRSELQWFLYSLTLIICIGAIVFTLNNDALYKQTIAKVTHVEIISKESTIDANHRKDIVYTQVVEMIGTNHTHKGERFIVTNTYTKSGAYDEQYKRGQKVFIKAGDKSQIIGEKRDTVLVSAFSVFTILLIIIVGEKGFYSLISLILNFCITLFVFNFYLSHKHIPMILIASVAVVLCTILTLTFVNGFTRKTWIAIVSTLAATLVTLLIVQGVIYLTSAEGVRYETMSYLTIPPKKVFLTTILIGTLGAVMDIAITITSSLHEIKVTQPFSNTKSLRTSGYEIGKDIIGPMTNILLFAYLSSAIPIIILYLANHSPIWQTFSLHWSLELARAVSGSIGIVLSIPITVWIASTMLGGETKR
ncbi:MAG: YibE/F family protein [Macrococcoides caseolyticum]